MDETEIIIRPFQLLTQRYTETCRFHVAILRNFIAKAVIYIIIPVSVFAFIKRKRQ